MKCKHCKGCLKVIRIDTKTEGYLFRYCPLCDEVFTASRRMVLDSTWCALVKEKYANLYGKGIVK